MGRVNWYTPVLFVQETCASVGGLKSMAVNCCVNKGGVVGLTSNVPFA